MPIDAGVSGGGPVGEVPNQEGLLQLGRTIDGRGKRASHRKRHSRRFRWIRGISIAVAVVLFAVVGFGVWDYFYLGGLIQHTHVDHLQASGSTENILLVGSTDRCALKVQNPMYGLCSQGVTGINSDIVMIIHLDPATHGVALLSIPRDLFVPNARIEGANKIDAALYEGPSQLAAAIEEDFAIPINHYVELNFDTFASVVNALGGVKMYFPRPVFDAESSLNIPRAGCYDLNGTEALEVVRARHLQIQPIGGSNDHSTWPQEAESDIARIRRTHEFLRVLATKVAARGLGNPFTDQSIATSVLPNLTVDQAFNEGEMVSLAETYAGTSISDVPQLTYPVILDQVGTYMYKGYEYGDVEFPIQPGGYKTVNQIFGAASGTSSWNDAALPKPQSFPMSVVNGTGTANQAATVAASLAPHGFKVVSTGDVTPVGPLSETVVWYGGPPPPKTGNWSNPALQDAEAVLQQVQGPAILGYNPAEVTPGAQVTLQTGTDISIAAVVKTVPPSKGHAKPHTTTTTSHAGTTVPPTVTPTTVYDPPDVAADNSFSAPTATAQPLAPWDPRPCNAAGTGPA
jgi:LCP family protein required for cell wall assembly